MWPWLVGAGVIALLATSSKGAAAPAYVNSAPSRATSTAHAVVPAGNVPLTPANIQKAASVAMARETNVTNLNGFGNALYVANYPQYGVPIIVKALHLSGQSVSPAAVFRLLGLYKNGTAMTPSAATQMQGWMGGGISAPSPRVTTQHIATRPASYTTTHGHVKMMTAAQKASELAQLHADLVASGGFGAPTAAAATAIRKQIQVLQATPTRG